MTPQILLPQGRTFFEIQLLPQDKLVQRLESDFAQLNWNGRMQSFFEPTRYFTKTGATYAPASIQPVTTTIAIKPENVIAPADYFFDQESARHAAVATREAYARILAHARTEAERGHANVLYFKARVEEQPRPVPELVHHVIVPDVGLYLFAPPASPSKKQRTRH